MEQLDLVYKALSNLEKNYAHSKKSREEYLLEKCGGDFDIGPFLILQALENAGVTEPEDIEKLSFVRNTFERIKETRGRHNTMTSFNFDELPMQAQLVNAILLGRSKGSKVEYTAQSELHSMRPRRENALHFICTGKDASVVSPYHCRYYKVYNTVLRRTVELISGGSHVPAIGDLVERKTGERYAAVASVSF